MQCQAMVIWTQLCKIKQAVKWIKPQTGPGNVTWSKGNFGAASSHRPTKKKKLQVMQIYFKTNNNRQIINSKQY